MTKETGMVEWSAEENTPVLVLDREYIIDALCERPDFDDLSAEQLTQIEENLPSKLIANSVYSFINSAINELTDEVTGRPPTLKTYGDWKKKAGFTMTWSIYTADHNELPIDHWPLDLSAPEGITDGVYRIRNYYGDTVGIGTGAIVSDGKFEPVSTERATLQAAALAHGLSPISAKEVGLHHHFIEKYEWDARRGCLDVHLGS